MTSDRIPALGFEPSGTLRGKDKLAGCTGARRLQLLPDLHFDLIDTYVSPDSVVVFYQNERGAQICEYLRLDARARSGRVRRTIWRIEVVYAVIASGAQSIARQREQDPSLRSSQ